MYYSVSKFITRDNAVARKPPLAILPTVVGNGERKSKNIL
jgi:hypothetical protein